MKPLEHKKFSQKQQSQATCKLGCRLPFTQKGHNQEKPQKGVCCEL